MLNRTIAITAALSLAIGATAAIGGTNIRSADAAGPALGTIVGREAIGGRLVLTIQPDNGAPIYGVAVIDTCFKRVDVVHNSGRWPNTLPECQ
jgi:hypothetical protein